MSDEIEKFATALGAKAPSRADSNYSQFRAVFPRPNYFIWHERVLIIKISRSRKPVWGVGKKYLDMLASFDYFLVLLISENEGWVFGKSEVSANIRAKKWKLREADQNYKINSPLPDKNSFLSTRGFAKKAGFDAV